MSAAAKQKRSEKSPASNQVEVLRIDTLSSIPWIVHGFSTRAGGVSTCYGAKSLNLGMTKHDARTNVERHRLLFEEALGAMNDEGTPWPLVQVKQIHSATIHHVNAPEKAPVGDGMITNTPGLLLTIKTADCVPVLIADVKKRAVGAFHAGWRGTVSRIVEKGVGEMRRYFSSDPQDLRAAIGPCIRKCCYAVGPEVQTEFESQFHYADELFEKIFDSNDIRVGYPLLFLNQRLPGRGEVGTRIHLDLVAANRRQLLDAGLPEDQISVVEDCTACDTMRFFSHRAEFGETGRMMAAIGIRL